MVVLDGVKREAYSLHLGLRRDEESVRAETTGMWMGSQPQSSFETLHKLLFGSFIDKLESTRGVRYHELKDKETPNPRHVTETTFLTQSFVLDLGLRPNQKKGMADLVNLAETKRDQCF